VRKVTQNQNGVKTQERIYLGAYEVYREYSGSGVSLERDTLHVMDDTRRIALVETRTVGSDNSATRLIRYQFANQLSSSCLELDVQAQIVSYEEYFPYGSTSYQAVQSQTQVPKRYRYTGNERDEENGLYYHRSRYYAVWLGRWMACDPLGISDNINVYSYGRNNPMSFTDATGGKSNPLDNTTGSSPDASKKGSDKPAVSAWAVLGTAVAALGGLGALFGAFLGPIGAVIGGVVGAVGGALVSGQAGLLAGVASEVWKAIKNVASSAWEGIKDAWKAIRNAASSAWKWIKNEQPLPPMIADQLAKVPKRYLDEMRLEGVRWETVESRVGEYKPAHISEDEAARGYKQGEKVTDVPGAYDPPTKTVIIAVHPAKKHGSANIVLHETGHALDESHGGNWSTTLESDSPDFRAAYEADADTFYGYLSETSGDEAQPKNPTGARSEAYAESFAEYYANPHMNELLQLFYPHLWAYWNAQSNK
jgi:RHS repeat-associated protein